jgi:hypothetical protein
VPGDVLTRVHESARLAGARARGHETAPVSFDGLQQELPYARSAHEMLGERGNLEASADEPVLRGPFWAKASTAFYGRFPSHS